jgi:hypothetical protein
MTKYSPVFRLTLRWNRRLVFHIDILPLLHPSKTLQCLDIEQLRQNPPKCSCFSSPFNCSSAGHIITGDAKYGTKWGCRVPDIERPLIPRTSLI